MESLASWPTRAFLQTKEARAQGKLRKDTALYLRHRMTVDKSAYNFLLRFMRELCGTVGSDLPEDDYKNRKQYAKTLCGLLSGCSRRIFRACLLLKHWRLPAKLNLMSSFSEDEVGNRVAAAASVDDLRASRSALRGDADYTWETSHLSGYLLAAAAAVGGHGEIFRATVSYRDERLVIEIQLIEAIEKRRLSGGIISVPQPRLPTLLLVQWICSLSSRMKHRPQWYSWSNMIAVVLKGGYGGWALGYWWKAAREWKAT